MVGIEGFSINAPCVENTMGMGENLKKSICKEGEGGGGSMRLCLLKLPVGPDRWLPERGHRFSKC